MKKLAAKYTWRKGHLKVDAKKNIRRTRLKAVPWLSASDKDADWIKKKKKKKRAKQR